MREIKEEKMLIKMTVGVVSEIVIRKMIVGVVSETTITVIMRPMMNVITRVVFEIVIRRLI